MHSASRFAILGLMERTHVLFAVDHQGNRFRGVSYDTYGEAIDAWHLHDNARLAGNRQHVKFYVVRDSSDRAWNRSPRTPAPWVNSVGQGYADSQGKLSRNFSGDEKAARRAIRLWFSEVKDQGIGGWFFTGSGNRRVPLAQGVRQLADIAKRRGWIAQGADGRWFALDPTDA